MIFMENRTLRKIPLGETGRGFSSSVVKWSSGLNTLGITEWKKDLWGEGGKKTQKRCANYLSKIPREEDSRGGGEKKKATEERKCDCELRKNFTEGQIIAARKAQ